MNSLGARELVGLGVLAVALLIGFMYLEPASSDSRHTPPGEIHLGSTATPVVMPTATPVVAPTATPTPSPTALGAPAGGWIIGYYQDAFSGGSILVSQTGARTVDLAYKTAPFLDFKDDAWSIRATAAYDLAAGRYAVTVEYQGRLTVTLNDQQLLSEEATVGAKTVSVEFEYAGGQAFIAVEGRDVKGPFRLKVAD